LITPDGNKSERMKLFSFFFAFVAANPMLNFLIADQVLDGEGDENDSLLKIMLLSPGLLGGNPAQAEQMNPILPLLLLDNDSDSDKTKALMMVMMMNQNAMSDTSSIIPLLLLDDSEGDKDMTSLFLLSTMMQNSCGDTNTMMNQYLPLLLLEDEGSSTNNLMTILMLQTMSEGNSAFGLQSILPFMLLDDATEDDNLLLMVLMSSMTGGMDHSQGFSNNFNLLVPLLLRDDSDSNMLPILLAMQSQAPGSVMSANAMLPLLIMNEDSNNEDLIFFMMMTQNMSSRC
jgi:hypothetical protein